MHADVVGTPCKREPYNPDASAPEKFNKVTGQKRGNIDLPGGDAFRSTWGREKHSEDDLAARCTASIQNKSNWKAR